MTPPGFVLFATDASDAGVNDARAWIKSQGLTGDDVKMVKREIEGSEMCLVISKRDVAIHPSI